MLRNTKLELLVAVRDYEVLAATITHRSIYAGGKNHDAILKVGHTQADWETFLETLDFKYDAGFGGQELYGTVWFTDGTWLERGEYDGSEWWDHNICPTLPDELLNQYQDTRIGCVQHDCDKCKAQAENNAELLRTVRAQAAEIESTWKLADAAEAYNTQLLAELEAAKADLWKQRVESAEKVGKLEAYWFALQAKLDTALMDVTCIPDMTEEITFLRAELDAIQTQEPVAWIVYAKGSERYCTLTFDLIKVPEIYIGGDAFPLYARPARTVAQPAKPLRAWTDDHMIRFAWLILSRQNDADSIQQRLEVFCKHDATYPLAKEKP